MAGTGVAVKQLREQLAKLEAKKDKYKGVAREQANRAASLALQVRSLEEQLEKERKMLFSQRAERELGRHGDTAPAPVLPVSGGDHLGGLAPDSDNFFTIR